jgi:hypothetical protein
MLNNCVLHDLRAKIGCVCNGVLSAWTCECACDSNPHLVRTHFEYYTIISIEYIDATQTRRTSVLIPRDEYCACCEFVWSVSLVLVGK